MRYLRFGEIPQSEKSINFIKMTLKQQEDFAFSCENGDMNAAFNCVPEDAYEAGLSVFEMDKKGMPVLSNLQLITSLLARINEPVYEVSGEEVACGNDGEPLIVNINVEKKRRIGKQLLIDLVLSVLLANFKTAEYNKTENNNKNQIFNFYREMKINKKTGEKVDLWEDCQGSDWIKMPPVREYMFNGWTFSNPIDGFDTTLGIR